MVGGIDQVIDRLQAIVQQSSRDGDRSGYFAALYRRVTETIRDAIRGGQFDDGARIEALEGRLSTTEAALDAERTARQDDREEFRRRLIEKDSYADVLLAHIRDGKGPPPPAYPVPPAPPGEPT